MNIRNLFDEVLSQRDEVLNDIFGEKNLSDLSESEKNELFMNVIQQLLFSYGTSEYFEDTEEFLNEFLREKGIIEEEDYDEEEEEDF